jgi:hypothetical protein
MSIIKRDSINLDPERPSSSVSAPSKKHARERGARFLRVDGVVRAIQVTCACGEEIVLELEFEAEPREEKA